MMVAGVWTVLQKQVLSFFVETMMGEYPCDYDQPAVHCLGRQYHVPVE